MRENRVEFVFRERPLTPSELYRNIVEPPRRETAIEVPQSRNDHSDDRNFDVGARLIEDEEIEALSLGNFHAGVHLLVRIETAELRSRSARSDRRIVARRQEGMIRKAQRRYAIKATFAVSRRRSSAPST